MPLSVAFRVWLGNADQMTNKLEMSQGARLEQSFSESNLPRTVGIAESFRQAVEQQLDESTASLPFADRVLAWLAPTLHREIIHFHGKNGKSLVEVFNPVAVEHLDRELAKQIEQWAKRSRKRNVRAKDIRTNVDT